MKLHVANLINKRPKQDGFTLVELLVVLVVIAILTIVGMGLKPKVLSYVAKYKVDSAIDLISAEAPVWRGNEFNYDNITIKDMCTEGFLNKTVCGKTGDGKKANPFGGDYIIGPSTQFSNQHINITVTNIKNGSVTAIQKGMMNRSIDQCTTFVGCNSIGKTTTSGHGSIGARTALNIDI